MVTDMETINQETHPICFPAMVRNGMTVMATGTGITDTVLKEIGSLTTHLVGKIPTEMESMIRTTHSRTMQVNQLTEMETDMAILRKGTVQMCSQMMRMNGLIRTEMAGETMETVFHSTQLNGQMLMETDMETILLEG